MLNLLVAMSKAFFSFLLALLFLSPIQDSNELVVITPAADQVIQGKLEISGSFNIPSVVGKLEFSYAYANEAQPTWFLMGNVDLPASEQNWFTWDTTTIVDGDYQLQVIWIKPDGSQVEQIVTPLHVRNYTAVEPSEIPTAEILTVTETTPIPTPDPVQTVIMVENQAALSTAQIKMRILAGGIGGLVLVLFFEIYRLIRRSKHRR
jgi:hypothetical protein